MFSQPYFVTPHAVIRFQERIAPLPATEVIEIIQAGFQHAHHAFWAHGHQEAFRCLYQGRSYYPLVGPGEGPWPAVVTVLDEGRAQLLVRREAEAKERLYARLVRCPTGRLKDLQALSGLCRWHVRAILAEWGVPVANGRYGGDRCDSGRGAAAAG